MASSRSRLSVVFFSLMASTITVGCGEDTVVGTDGPDVVASMGIDHDNQNIYFLYGQSIYVYDGVDFSEFGIGTDLEILEGADNLDVGDIDGTMSLVVRANRALRRFELSTGALLDEYQSPAQRDTNTSIRIDPQGRVWIPTLEGIEAMEVNASSRSFSARRVNLARSIQT